MDYKEKLKEALNSDNTDYEVVRWIEQNFPELKESEDERIRKDIVFYIAAHHKDDGEKACWLSWLEKQGEQETADKVEPKFKVGDWVVYCGKTCKITGLHNGIFTITNQDGSYFFNRVESTTEPVFHLWTIQDAKNGDVLAIEPIEGYHSPFIAIYKKQNEEDFDSYCFIGFDGNFYKGENGHSTEEVHPATKEQHEQLERAMADAGYTFDFEKKELKKIEQNPAWSEEDIELLDNAIKFIEYSVAAASPSLRTYSPTLTGKEIPFLKALKDRVQPKKEWSEEDERMIDNIIFELEENQENISGVGYKIDWLTFLKERYTWKPSDEQMAVLNEVIDYAANSELQHWSSFIYTLLKSLREQLKKLRGE